MKFRLVTLCSICSYLIILEKYFVPGTTHEAVVVLSTYLVPDMYEHRSKLDKYIEVYPRSSDLW